MGCKSVIWLCVAVMLFSPREKTVDSAALAVKVGNSSERHFPLLEINQCPLCYSESETEQPGSRQKANNNTALRWLCMCMCECI